MGRIESLEEIAENPKLAIVFLLRILFLLTIAMRDLLASEGNFNEEKVRIINQINHRVLQVAQELVLNDKDNKEVISSLLAMLKSLGLGEIVFQALEESRSAIRRN